MLSSLLTTTARSYFVFGWALIISLLSPSCVTQQQVSDVSNFIVAKDDNPWVIAHRGGRALFPENTMIAFDGSHNLGVDALEMDVCLTKDGHLVTHHDLTIDRTSDGSGKVIDHTLQELQTLNFGHHFQNLQGENTHRNLKVTIPTIEEVFAKYGNQYPLLIEIKNKSTNGLIAGQKLFALIKEYKLEDRVIIASFHDEVIQNFRSISNNSIITGTTFSETKNYVISKKSGLPFLYKPQCAAVQLPMEAKGMNFAKSGFVKMAHKRNMIIHYWTINTTENMEKLINFGVDGIMTDRPDLLIDYYDKMKLK